MSQPSALSHAEQVTLRRRMLVDIEGEVAHRWQMPVRPGRDAVILANGNLGYNGSHSGDLRPYPPWPLWRGGDFYEATPSGEIVWRHQDIRHHHDAQWRPALRHDRAAVETNVSAGHRRRCQA